MTTTMTIEVIRAEMNAREQAVLEAVADCAAGLENRGLISGEEAIAVAHAAIRPLSEASMFMRANRGSFFDRVNAKLKAPFGEDGWLPL